MLKYPYYHENSKLKLSVVTTVNGEKEYKANCVKINDIYYVKGVDAVQVDSKWYLKDNLYYDHEFQVYRRSSKNLDRGVVSINEIGVVTYGYFTPWPYKNCKLRMLDRIHTCIDYKLLVDNPYVMEDISTGVFHMKDVLSPAELVLYSRKRMVNIHSNTYNIVDNRLEFERASFLHDIAKFKIDPDIKKVSKLLTDVTFGAEIETINGSLPDYTMNKHGIIVCKDGSLKDEDGNYPPEYVTIPLSGAKGLQTLRDVSKEITKRSDIDYRCSYHLHLGGFKKSRLFLVSLMKLCIKIQEEVFDMFPYYKRDEIRYADKEKNYCKKLPNIIRYYKSGDFNGYINESYQNLYSFLSGGRVFDNKYNFKKKKNPWGQNKWNIDSRYYWVNFTNLVFGKHDTIEFRMHTPTTNSDKMINWLLMCNAIIQYAETYPSECISTKPISFIDVLNFYKKKFKTSYAISLSDNLIKYYEKRVEQFKKEAENGEYLSSKEITDDSTFSFNVLNINI